jgi:hypothetical protein
MSQLNNAAVPPTGLFGIEPNSSLRLCCALSSLVTLAVAVSLVAFQNPAESLQNLAVRCGLLIAVSLILAGFAGLFQVSSLVIKYSNFEVQANAHANAGRNP